MNGLKHIALVICASNFERHRNMILAVHRRFKEAGNIVLYVITNYGVYRDGDDFSHGEPADYSLLEYISLDGCILEANLGSDQLVQKLAGILKRRAIPMVTINLQVEGVPSVTLDIKRAGEELMEHLTGYHGCERINLVLNEGNSTISAMTMKIYRDGLQKKGIPFDERRVFTTHVGLDTGHEIYEAFDRNGVMKDAQAVICVHDVCTISLCMEIEDRGGNVPGDVILCSSNHSGNSDTFRPDITGIDRMDDLAANRACELLIDLIGQKTTPMDTPYEVRVCYGHSCGCQSSSYNETSSRLAHRRLTIGKIENGKQISSMMRFNDTLEDVETLDQLGDNIHLMMEGIGCNEFFCCLNQDDLPYIINCEKDPKNADSSPYCDTMIAITGSTARDGRIKNSAFSREMLVPVERTAGDMFLILPVHHLGRDYGYMVFLNEYLPIELYNYRICQESIGSSIENLHRQMILRNNIAELDSLHMRDHLTNLFNRYALKRHRGKYIMNGNYSVAMLDMDGLKIINDTFGHLAGNNAICLVADVIAKSVDESDLVVRYGGDEFQILSYITDPSYWEKVREVINSKLEETVMTQKLPYNLGVSMGYAISERNAPLGMDDAIERSDQAMYQDKRRRKVGR